MLNDKRIVRPWKSSVYLRVLQNLRKITAKFFRSYKIKRFKANVKTNDVSIICQFCAGGMIYHDLGMKFLSPTINLAFDGPDFIKFCSDIPGYLHAELVEFHTEEVSYPVGRLNDIEIRFVHYKSFEEAKKKWDERCKRINFDNILIIATDRDGMGSAECMQDFDKLPYKKIMYTSKKYDKYEWSIYCPVFKSKHCVGVMTSYADFFGNRYYEKYVDISKVLNDNKIK